jgi:hypothetical protein
MTRTLAKGILIGLGTLLWCLLAGALACWGDDAPANAKDKYRAVYMAAAKASAAIDSVPIIRLGQYYVELRVELLAAEPKNDKEREIRDCYWDVMNDFRLLLEAARKPRNADGTREALGVFKEDLLRAEKLYVEAGR